MLSRAKPAIGPGSTTPAKENKKKKQMPKVEDFLNMRDYTGAITLLEVIFKTKKYMGSYFSKVKEKSMQFLDDNMYFIVTNKSH